jgi:hypothetical protein
MFNRTSYPVCRMSLGFVPGVIDLREPLHYPFPMYMSATAPLAECVCVSYYSGYSPGFSMCGVGSQRRVREYITLPLRFTRVGRQLPKFLFVCQTEGSFSLMKSISQQTNQKSTESVARSLATKTITEETRPR